MFLLYGVSKLFLSKVPFSRYLTAEWKTHRFYLPGAMCDSKGVANSPDESGSEGNAHIPLDANNGQTIKEGKAEIVKESSKHVFYNPVQEFNRDLSIAVLTIHAQEHFRNVRARKAKQRQRVEAKEQSVEGTGDDTEIEKQLLNLEPGKVYEDGMQILEALSATGLRSIRYAKEVPGVKSIVANDLSANAIESLKINIAHNHVENMVNLSHNDATMVMYQHRTPPYFDVIDLDPYGCPSIFLDGAVQAIANGGLLMVTCTDMAVLAGNTPETCYSKYGSISLRNRCCHEMALRIALQCIESHANRYGRYITPLLSISADFYIRLFVRVNTSPSMCKRSINKLSMVYQCVGCESVTLQPLGQFKNINPDNPSQMKTVLPHVPPVPQNCLHCDSRHHVGGPIWSDPIQDGAFISDVLDLVSADDAEEKFGTAKRLQGMLSVLEEELVDVPLYHSLDRLCAVMGVSQMPLLTFRSALLNAGYQVSSTHTKPTAVKTDAPQSVVWDILRTWERDNPVSKKRLQDRVCANLLRKPCETKVDFSMHPAANPSSRQEGKCRYQINPLPYWGPGVRSIANLQDGTIQEKQKKNQGKKTWKRKRQAGDKEERSNEESHQTKMKLDEN